MKNTFLIPVLILLLLPLLGASQGWEKFYDGIDDAVAPIANSTADGGLVMFGAQVIEGTSPVEKRAYLIKLDADGVVEWEYFDNERAGTFLYPYDVIATSTGDFVLSFLHSFSFNGEHNVVVLNISPGGTVNWEYNLTDTNSVGIAEVIELSNGDFAMAGIFSDTSLNQNGYNLYQLNAAGELQWEEEIVVNTSNISILVSELIQDSNDDLVLVGVQAFIGSPSQDILMFKYDTLGNEIFSLAYQKPAIEYPAELLEDTDGGYLVGSNVFELGGAGYLSLLKVDNLGNELWYKQYAGIGEEARINGLELGVENGLVISGSKKTTTNEFFDYYLLKLDALGEEEWLKEYGRDMDDVNAALLTHDQGYYLAGTSIKNNVSVGYVVKTDVNGISFSNELSGVVYNDPNFNCERDTLENGLQNWLVTATKGDNVFYSLSDSMGNYSFLLDTGIYQIETVPISFYWNVCINNFEVDFQGFNQLSNEDIGAQTFIDCPLMNVSIGAPFIRRCFPNTYYVNYCNLGTQLAEDASIEVTLDSFMTFLGSSFPLEMQVDNVLTFDLGDVEVGECGAFTVDVLLGDPDNNCEELPLGFTNCIEARIFPDTLCNIIPLFSGASVDVGAVCTGDSIRFTITNVGTAAMSTASEYIVIEDDVILMIGTVDLGINETEVVSVPTNGSTFRMEVAQEINHPGSSMPSTSVENCGASGTDFSIGFINQFSPDDADNFIDIDCQQNIGSYDPNDKIGYPLGYTDEHFINRGQALDYQIRFQNTGTDTAFNVVIRDTLTELLDLATVRPGISSHDYIYDITPEGIITFRFENIQLPDSTVNLEGSNGFVRFKVEQVADLDYGSVINNSAAIYFDFNAPIITNTTVHTVQQPLLTTAIVDPVENQPWNVSVFPNPFESQVFFRVEGLKTEQSTFQLYNINGQLIHSSEFAGQEYQVNASALTSGMYFFRILSNDTLVATGKIVRQ